jgi:DNA invertase Pin-like site-specific DNA recombinase
VQAWSCARGTGQQCALFTQLGLRLAGVYVDNDLSAFTGKPHPDYLAMLTDLDAGRTRVVTAWHTDRLHRTPGNWRPILILPSGGGS